MKNSDIFASLNGVINVSSKKESIYNLSIFEGKNEKERKALRTKLRTKRDSVIQTWNNTKDKEQKKIIHQKWLEYAKLVYKDINILFESNTTDDKAISISKFVTEIKNFK